MIGKKLGNYEVADKLGEGGMGEVWKARDERLNRTVAIKMLPRELAEDPARRTRFEQEARALGALNHPNILTIFDVGEDEGRAYMVSELVDGEPLRTLLDRGPLPARKAIDIAVQIAEGMAAAHALGIVHRDLKPENVIVRPTGQVKVLDFGLAKQSAPAADPAATVAMTVSQPGMVMGTVGYMSPEQVRGEPADARSDIFSFGCMLYEMMGGRRAFQGTTAIVTMHAILNAEPAEFEPDQVKMTPALATIVRRCLEKRPEQRFQSASDLAFALRSVTGTTTSVQAAVVEPQTGRNSWLAPLAAIAGAAALFAGGFFLHARLAPHETPRFQRITFRKGLVGGARFMPDGENVVYMANWEGGPFRTYLATPGTPDSRDLGLPDGSRLLSASSKGDLAIATFAAGSPNGTLMRTTITGGQTRPLLEGVMAADWAPDAASMAVLRAVNGVNRIEYPLGKVIADNLVAPLESIRVSPDGALVAYEHFVNGRSVEINVVDRSGKSRSLGIVSGQTALNTVSPLLWTPKGDEIWFRSFDSGDPQTIYGVDLKGRKRVVANLPGRVEAYDISRDGKLLLTMGQTQFGIMGTGPGDTEERDLSCLDTGILAGISDDGRLIAATVFGAGGGPKGSIYMRKTDGSPAVHLGDGTAYVVSADGKWVSGYVPDDAGSRRFVMMPTGPGEVVETNVPGLTQSLVVGWLEEKQHYLVSGLAGKQRQCFEWDASRNAVRPVCPPGIGAVYVTFLSPDRKKVLTYGPGDGWFAYPMDGGPAQAVHGIQNDEIPVGWRADSNAIYVRASMVSGMTARVSIVETATGKRSLWKDLHLTRPIDSPGDLHMRISPDGRAYAYNFSVLESELYIARGLN